MVVNVEVLDVEYVLVLVEMKLVVVEDVVYFGVVDGLVLYFYVFFYELVDL